MNSRAATGPGRLEWRVRRAWSAFLKYGVSLFFVALCLYPMILMLSTALKDPNKSTGDPFELFRSIRLENLVDAWTLGHFGGYFMNTVIVTVPTVIGVIALSTLTGYAFATFDFRGRTVVFYVFVLGLMVPFFSIMIPLYFSLRDVGLLNTYLAVILPSVAGAGGAGLPLGVFLMRSFFADMPRELGDAARIDGCDEVGVFWRVMLPLSAPGVGALAILAFLSAWNTFLLPLLYLQGESQRTLAIGLLVFSGGRSKEIELLAAGSLIMIVPVLVFFVLLQRHFVRGLTSGALKG